MASSPFEILPLIQNAGAVFMGHYSPEPLGDYMAGPNHVLPTGGTAKFFSPLSIDDFIKKSSIISFNKKALMNLYDDIISFADAGRAYGACKCRKGKKINAQNQCSLIAIFSY